MLKRTTLSLAVSAAVFGAAGVASAANQPFVPGWNKAMCVNGSFIPGNPGNPSALPPVPSSPDEVIVVVALIPDPLLGTGPAPPVLPPPIPIEGEFSTSDPIAIGLIAPYCENINNTVPPPSFFFFWDAKVQLPLYFSVWRPDLAP